MQIETDLDFVKLESVNVPQTWANKIILNMKVTDSSCESIVEQTRVELIPYSDD